MIWGLVYGGASGDDVLVRHLHVFNQGSARSLNFTQHLSTYHTHAYTYDYVMHRGFKFMSLMYH